MATNQTMDGVTREAVAALEKARDVLRAIIRDKAAGVHYASAQAACHQINGALLDAPAVQCREVDGVRCPNPECCAWIAPNSECRQCKQAAKPQGEPVAPFYICAVDFNRLVRDDTAIARVSVSRERRGPFTEPLYAEQPAPVAVSPAQVEPAYRLLGDGDVIKEGDETLNDDTATWGKVPMGVFLGMPYNRRVMLPVRRAKPR